MTRTEKDCIHLGAIIAELNDSQLALLFGLLIGSYLLKPNALFWDVLERFSVQRRVL